MLDSDYVDRRDEPRLYPHHPRPDIVDVMATSTDKTLFARLDKPFSYRAK